MSGNSDKQAWPTGIMALTGGIGSGKSTASTMLKECGAGVVSADELAREVVSPGSPGLAAIRAEFGEEFFTPAGALDREKLAKEIFANKEKRLALEAITHPLIRKQTIAKFNQMETPVRVYDVPLYFESDLQTLPFKAVVVVDAPKELRIQRLLARGGLEEDDIEHRMAAQIPLAKKVKRADYVLDNSGTEGELREQVEKLYRTLLTLN